MSQVTSPWLTMEQLCDRLQIPITTARYWRIRNYGPPAVRVGRCLRYRLSDVQEWESSLNDPREAVR